MHLSLLLHFLFSFLLVQIGSCNEAVDNVHLTDPSSSYLQGGILSSIFDIGTGDVAATAIQSSTSLSAPADVSETTSLTSITFSGDEGASATTSNGEEPTLRSTSTVTIISITDSETPGPTATAPLPTTASTAATLNSCPAQNISTVTATSILTMTVQDTATATATGTAAGTTTGTDGDHNILVMGPNGTSTLATAKCLTVAASSTTYLGSVSTILRTTCFPVSASTTTPALISAASSTSTTTLTGVFTGAPRNASIVTPSGGRGAAATTSGIALATGGAVGLYNGPFGAGGGYVGSCLMMVYLLAGFFLVVY